MEDLNNLRYFIREFMHGVEPSIKEALLKLVDAIEETRRTASSEVRDHYHNDGDYITGPQVRGI